MGGGERRRKRSKKTHGRTKTVGGGVKTFVLEQRLRLSTCKIGMLE